MERDPSDRIPDREEWAPAPPVGPAGRLVTEAVVVTFQLNARLMEVAQGLAAAGGITAAWWQVLGGIVDRPRTMAEVGRNMGMSRQGVRRVADLLVEHGLATYQENPAHRRAKLLACTEAGEWAIHRISHKQHPWAESVGSQLDAGELQAMIATMRRMIAVLESPPGS